MNREPKLSAQRAAAERDALLELIAIFTHDISNPLQSITVLCELGLDEAAPGSEEQFRTQQCLQAAQQMRGILQGLGGISLATRGTTTLSSIVSRVQATLSRRLERSNMVVDAELSQVTTMNVPGGLEFVVLTTCLGFMRAVVKREANGPKSLSVRATPLESGQCRVLISARTASDSLQFPEDYGRRAGEILADLGGSFTLEGDTARIEFAVTPR